MRKLTGLASLVLLLVLASVAGAASHGPEEYLIVPKDYDPAKAWPLMVVSQNQVSEAQMAGVPYFCAYGASGGCVGPILEVAKKYNIDPYRIYGTGFSRSGHGLLETTWTRPHRFAAIAPVCEDMRPKAQYKIQKPDQLKYICTPTYLLHGKNDSFRKTGRANYEIMKAAGCPVSWDFYPGGHSPDGLYFRNIRKITDFFDKHKLDPHPKRVVHVVYLPGAARAFWVDAAVGPLTKDAKTYPHYSVTIGDGNRIEVDADPRVRKLVLSLNEQLVDMTQPVTVVRAGKTLYKGKPTGPVTVTLSEGKADESKTSPIPLWRRLEDLRTKPGATGAHDWVYVDIHTAFKDARTGKPDPRRVSLDIGLRAVDAPKMAVMKPEHKRFLPVDASVAKEVSADMATVGRKLPVTVKATTATFVLTGAVVPPAVQLGPAEATGATGEVALVRVRLTNAGKTAVTGSARLARSPFMTYPIGLWPKGPGWARGILEYAGTRGVSWQFLKHRNEAYQVLAFLMLSAEGNVDVKPMNLTPQGYRKSFWGATRTITLAAGKSIELPVLLISVPSPDAKAKKPKIPDMGAILEQIKPDLLKLLK